MVKRVSLTLACLAGTLCVAGTVPPGGSRPAATTCVFVGPVTVENQQILDQYGVCLPV